MTDSPNDNRDLVIQTVDLLNRLAEYYETPEECAAWFRAPQPLLGGGAIPIDLIAEGKVAELHRVWDGIDAPSDPEDTEAIAIELGHFLCEKLHQGSFSVQGPEITHWFSRREQDQS